MVMLNLHNKHVLSLATIGLFKINFKEQLGLETWTSDVNQFCYSLVYLAIE